MRTVFMAYLTGSIEAVARKDEILQAVHVLCGGSNKIKRYQGEAL